MERIGSKKLAKRILNWHLHVIAACGDDIDDVRTELSWSLPGWRLLGAGMYRFAYLGPDGYVYKIDDHEWNTRGIEYNCIYGNNAGEWQNYKRLHEAVLTTKLRLAKSYLWSFGLRQVMCQEIVNTDNPMFGHEWPKYECKCDQHPFYKGNCFTGEVANLEDMFDLDDLHSSNLWPQADGTFMACDFAGS